MKSSFESFPQDPIHDFESPIESMIAAAADLDLVKMLEKDSFQEFIQSFVSLYRIGIRVFAKSGAKLADFRAGNGAFCGYLWESGQTRKACTQIVEQLKNDDFPFAEGQEKSFVVNCFSGLRYWVVPLVYQGDLLGRLMVGPYRPMQIDMEFPEVTTLEPKTDKKRLQIYMEPIRSLDENSLQQMTQHLQKSMDVMMFAGHRAMLTSSMHIASTQESYAELEEKNRSLREANDRLKELDRMKSNFLATISHELRTPLTSIIGYSEMILEEMAGPINTEQKEYLDIVVEKGGSLLSLISQILDISKVESGTLRLDYSSFVPDEAVRLAVTSVVPQMQKKKIQFSVKITPHLPKIWGDKAKIAQILINLLGNAVKFTPEEGNIDCLVDCISQTDLDMQAHMGQSHSVQHAAFTAPIPPQKAISIFDHLSKQYIRMIVKDSGIGIPTDKLEKVFERFYQVDNSSTREFGGTGLGLSIVKNFVDAHNGRIEVSSIIGTGSTFTVYIPVEE